MKIQKQSARYFLFGMGAGFSAMLGCMLARCIFRKCRHDDHSADEQTILIRSDESDNSTEPL